MKYLKTYKIFESNEELERLKKEISKFNSKKGNLERLIVGNIGEDKKDISNNVEQIVGENIFLKKWATVMRKEARIKDLELRLEYFDQLHRERTGNLQNVKNLSDPEDRRSQEEKLNNQLSDIKDNVSKIKENIKELENEVKEDKAQLEEYINTLVENLSNMEIE